MISTGQMHFIPPSGFSLSSSDGFLDTEEIEAVYGVHHVYSQKKSKDEEDHAKKAQLIVKTILDTMDTDRDGKISLAEFEKQGLDALPNFNHLGAEGHHYDMESGVFSITPCDNCFSDGSKSSSCTMKVPARVIIILVHSSLSKEMYHATPETQVSIPVAVTSLAAFSPFHSRLMTRIPMLKIWNTFSSTQSSRRKKIAENANSQACPRKRWARCNTNMTEADKMLHTRILPIPLMAQGLIRRSHRQETSLSSRLPQRLNRNSREKSHPKSRNRRRDTQTLSGIGRVNLNGAKERKVISGLKRRPIK
jgi:hypothetical protein